MAATSYEAVPGIARDERQRGGILVMKFGGTSVGNPERLLNVAKRIVGAKEQGGRVVAVLSAMVTMSPLAHAIDFPSTAR